MTVSDAILFLMGGSVGLIAGRVWKDDKHTETVLELGEERALVRRLRAQLQEQPEERSSREP